jgi:hypothetical protein
MQLAAPTQAFYTRSNVEASIVRKQRAAAGYADNMTPTSTVQRPSITPCRAQATFYSASGRTEAAVSKLLLKLAPYPQLCAYCDLYGSGKRWQGQIG